MDSIFPPKLKHGDTVAIVAPSRSLAIISGETQQIANHRLNELGLEFVFGRHCSERNIFNSSSISSRTADLHEAFANPTIKVKRF